MTDREINEVVARKLGHNSSGAYINAPNGKYAIYVFSDGRTGHLPDYCHDIAAAWTIIEWVAEQSFNTRKMFMAHLTAQSIVVEDGAMVQPFWWFLFFAQQPMAICLAFLKLS